MRWEARVLLRRLTFSILLAVAASACAAPSAFANSAPTCPADTAVHLKKNAAHSLQFACSDADNDQLTYAIVEGPQHGTLSSISSNNYGGSTTYYSVTYTPEEGYTGDDSYTYRASDATDHSEVASVSFDIYTPAPPTCKEPPAFTMRPTGSAFFYLAGPNACLDASDDFMPTFDLRITKQPEHGIVEFVENNDYGVTYSPAHDYAGPDSFSYVASNSGGDSAEVTQQITVDPDYNRSPACSNPGAPILRVGQSRTVLLTCFDQDFDPVTFQVDSTGTRGTVGAVTDDSGDDPGSPFPNARYVKYTAPAEVGDGSDQFSYTSTDDRGATSPQPAVQKFDVRPSDYNTAPHCQSNPYGNQVESGSVGWIGTSCTDDEHDPLSFTVTEQPSHGSLVLRSSGTGHGEPYRYFDYKPTGDYVGDDSFTYSVSDDRGASTEQTVNVKVVKPQPPSCTQPPEEKAKPDRDRGMMLYCFGGFPFGGGVPSSFAITSQPEHGTVRFPDGATKNWVVYRSDPGYEGPDGFSYKAINAAGESNVVTQQITVSATYNRRPYCQPSFTGFGDKVRSGSSRDLVLYCWDSDGDPITYTTTAPAHGTLGAVQPPAESSGCCGGPSTVKYTPADGYLGPDSFTVTASDGSADSYETTVYVTVVDPATNKPPQCWSGNSVKVAANSRYSFGRGDLSCWDQDGDPISYDIATPPQHGTLSQPDSQGGRTYTPTDPSWTGEDSFTYTANDGRATTDEVTLRVDVTDPVDVTAEPVDLPSGEPARIENYTDEGGKSLIAVQRGDVRQFPSACMPLDVDTTIASGSGSVAGAQLVLAPADGGASKSFDMTRGDGDSWSAHIDCVEAGELSVRWDFTEGGTTTPLSKPLGGIVLIDPQGVVYDKGRYEAAIAAGSNPDDARAAAAVEGASVELQRFAGGQWSKVPSGDPGISPNVNPQITKSDGVFRWDVSAGRYRVVVKREGYEDATSSAVDIPPPVTNLHVALTALPVQAPPQTGDGGSGGGSDNKPGDSGGTPSGSGPPPGSDPVPTPPGDGGGPKPPGKPKPACYGLKGKKKAQCESKQRLKKALAKCAKLKGKSKRAQCAKRARARAKCDSLHGRKKTACIKRANALGTHRPRKH
jgi:hypothetical protein